MGAKTTDSLMDCVICLASKALGWVVKVKDPNAFQEELKNDYIINQELSNHRSTPALKCGRLLAPANVALITTKHIDFSAPMLSQLLRIPHHFLKNCSQAFEQMLPSCKNERLVRK